jgi:glutaredoxin 2
LRVIIALRFGYDDCPNTTKFIFVFHLNDTMFHSQVTLEVDDVSRPTRTVDKSVDLIAKSRAMARGAGYIQGQANFYR